MTFAEMTAALRFFRTPLVAARLVATSLFFLCGTPAFAGEKHDLRDMNSSDLKSNAERNFRHLDRNRDGFVDVKEAPVAKRKRMREGKLVMSDSGRALWIQRRDKNADGRVDSAEFEAAFNEMVAMIRTGQATVTDLPAAK